MHYILGAVLVLLLVIIFFACTFRVNPGERGMLYSWSGGLKPQVYGEGRHFKWPIVNNAIIMNIRVQKQQEDAMAPTKDLLEVTSTVAVNFKIDPQYVQDIYRTIGAATSTEDYMQTNIMNPVIQESVRQATAKYTAQQLVENRTALKADVDARIAERLAQYHIIVTDVSMTNFKLPDEFQNAINAKQSAEQKVLEQQRLIEFAEAQANQTIAKAYGDAKAIEIVNTQLRNSPEYTKFLIVSKWDGKMPLALGSGSLISIASTNTPSLS